MPSVLARTRGALREFRDDLRRPFDASDGSTRGERFGKRFRFLLKKYGWRLLVLVFFYYLIRDLLLYVVLPYLAVKHLLPD